MHDPDEAAPQLRLLLIRHGLEDLYSEAALRDACRDAAYAMGIPFRQARQDMLAAIADRAAQTIIADNARRPCCFHGSAGERRTVQLVAGGVRRSAVVSREPWYLGAR
jgi:hypothetical protein